MPKVVFISDTHNLHAKVRIPECDILVHSGDATGRGTFQEVSSFLFWLSQQPAKHKVLIWGNHDHLQERDPGLANMLLSEHPSITYLENSSAEVMGLKFWGSPWTPKFFDWAFNADPDKLIEVWNQIPEGLDILVTHGPPFGILDLAESGDQIGCKSLKYEVMNRAKPKIHIFGHCHEGYGTFKFESTLYINASTCNSKYQPVNPPIVMEIL
jgi:Icc-related predicted phosphoesterase